MAPQSRRAETAVAEERSLLSELLEHVGRFDFVQAVRLLRRLLPDREPVGGHADPADELIRFRSDVSAVFPKAELSSIAEPRPGEPVELEVAFMGVATPASFGSLPRRYAEEIRALLRQKNPVMRDFMDLFNHRMVSLFYRARERHYPVLLFERGADSPFEHALAAVLGLGTAGLARRLALSDRALFARAGLLAMRPMPAQALEAVLESVFQVRVRVAQLQPSRHPLEEEDRSRLGERNARLGLDFLLGEEISLGDARFTVRVGPLDWASYQTLLPPSPEDPGAADAPSTFRQLTDLVRFATRDEHAFDVQLVLAACEGRGLRLGEAGLSVGQLGWSSWLQSGMEDRARDDAVLAPRPAQARGSPAREAA